MPKLSDAQIIAYLRKHRVLDLWSGKGSKPGKPAVLMLGVTGCYHIMSEADAANLMADLTAPRRGNGAGYTVPPSQFRRCLLAAAGNRAEWTAAADAFPKAVFVLERALQIAPDDGRAWGSYNTQLAAETLVNAGMGQIKPELALACVRKIAFDRFEAAMTGDGRAGQAGAPKRKGKPDETAAPAAPQTLALPPDLAGPAGTPEPILITGSDSRKPIVESDRIAAARFIGDFALSWDGKTGKVMRLAGRYWRVLEQAHKAEMFATFRKRMRGLGVQMTPEIFGELITKSAKRVSYHDAIEAAASEVRSAQVLALLPFEVGLSSDGSLYVKRAGEPWRKWQFKDGIDAAANLSRHGLPEQFELPLPALIDVIRAEVTDTGNRIPIKARYSNQGQRPRFS